MADQNTPLISELLALVGNHTEFEAWQQQGKLPAKLLRKVHHPSFKPLQFFDFGKSKRGQNPGDTAQILYPLYSQ